MALLLGAAAAATLVARPDEAGAAVACGLGLVAVVLGRRALAAGRGWRLAALAGVVLGGALAALTLAQALFLMLRAALLPELGLGLP